MKNLFTRLIPWLIPENEIHYLKKFVHVVKKTKFNLENSKYLKPNLVLNNKYKDKRCFIIGNGTSISQLNMLKLKGECVFSMNLFFKHDQLAQINPTFYCDIEPFELMYTYAENCLYHPNNYYKQIDQSFKNLNTIFFFRDSCRMFFKNNNLFQNKSVFYLKNSTSFTDDAKYSTKSVSDISKPFSFLGGSIYNSICCCAYMGFTEIYLIGFDADYLLKNNKNHFYNEPEIIYAKNTKRYDWHVSNTETNKTLALHLYTQLEKLDLVRKYFEPKGIKIYNAGIGGFVDTFERVDYETLF